MSFGGEKRNLSHPEIKREGMDATMRIAMVGHKRVPSREGGIEVVVEELAARMVVHGHAVTCYNRSGHHVSGREYDAEHLDEYRGIRLKHLPTIDRKGLAAVTSSFFGCLAAAFGPYDVVHVHAEGPAMFSWIPRLTGKRVILTIHGLDWARDKWKGSFGSWYIRMGEKTGARCAHEIIVLNHSTQKYFLDTYGRTTRYIPNGVNPAAPVPADIIREKYGLEKDSYILYLGRMVPEKGCHYLVDAFKKLDTDKKLVIAGGSSDTHWYMDELKEQAGGDERVIFTGFVDGQLREELYSNAFLFVLPSDLEGMPLCLLEAMSYGTVSSPPTSRSVPTSSTTTASPSAKATWTTWLRSSPTPSATPTPSGCSSGSPPSTSAPAFRGSASWRKRSRSTRKNNGIQKSACCIRSRRFSL